LSFYANDGPYFDKFIEKTPLAAPCAAIPLFLPGFFKIFFCNAAGARTILYRGKGKRRVKKSALFS
jgi:hypothetical protein